MDWNWIHEPTNNKRFQREDKSFHMEAPTRGALGALIKSQRAWPTPLRTTGSDCAPSRGVTGDHLMQCSISSIPFVQNDVWLFLARSAHLPADISNWKRNSKWRKSFLSILRWIRYAQCAFGLPGGSVGKEFACSVGDLGLIPGLGRSPGEGNGNLLQYSGLKNSMDCIVQEVAKSRTHLSKFHCQYAFSWDSLGLSGKESACQCRKIPWTEESGRLQSMESQRVGHVLATKHRT